MAALLTGEVAWSHLSPQVPTLRFPTDRLLAAFEQKFPESVSTPRC